ncbi:MAG TPA: nucleotidyltransferase domain-containing protein [Solirubrobacterales bacterium]|jgi:predicted nucleotidyltransferase|nr:nucleotidyltransferase domain-containing protein [Solirubrobacterales bacterium]
MDFGHPLRAVTPTLDGDVLMVLAGADEGFSGRRIHQLLDRGSEQGVRKAAERLVEQGVVLRRQVGRAKVYRLNRQHVAASHIEGLAGLRGELLRRLRAALDGWEVSPSLALLFGSAARGGAGPGSDLDLFLVRPANVEEDSRVWTEQLATLERDATDWTGNDARIVEFGESELFVGALEGVVDEALSNGIDLYGSRRRFRRSIKDQKRS